MRRAHTLPPGCLATPSTALLGSGAARPAHGTLPPGGCRPPASLTTSSRPACCNSATLAPPAASAPRSAGARQGGGSRLAGVNEDSSAAACRQTLRTQRCLAGVTQRPRQRPAFRAAHLPQQRLPALSATSTGSTQQYGGRPGRPRITCRLPVLSRLRLTLPDRMCSPTNASSLSPS